MKRGDQKMIEWEIRSQLRGVRFHGPGRMVYSWYEPNKKRDLDNISSYGRKVIQDALVACRVIENDGWERVAGFEDMFFVDKKNPRVEIEIREVE